jgi:serine/threonine protein kinase
LHDDLSGSMVGSYRITGQLNVGGMGAVFRAQHELLGKAAAVKMLRPELCTNAEIVERFFKEARAATQIRHPGIVEVFDFGYHQDGRAFLVMEFLDGEPLSARLARTGLSEIQAAVIARGIASALGAAHAKGIIHRDLKPDNVMLVPDPDMPAGERPKVLDFGIAKLAEEDNRQVSKTRTGALMGTPAYMAPEQARAAGEIDARADLYSLGCILYEMLTGAPPFVAEGAGEIISLQLFAEPELPSKRRPGISEDMDGITMRLLAKEPTDRFGTAHELVEALSAAIPTLSGRMTAVMPMTGRRQALVVPTQSDAAIPVPNVAPGATQEGRAAAPTTPLPVGDHARPASRSRAMRPAILAGVVTLGLTAAVTVFLLLRKEKTRTPPAPPVMPVVDNHVIAQSDPAPTPTSPDISYFLELVPVDASVTVDGQAVTLRDGFFVLPSRPDRRLIVVTAPGYQEASVTVDGDKNDHHRIVLTRVGDKAHPTVDQVVGETTRTPDSGKRGKGNKRASDGVQSASGGTQGSSGPVEPKGSSDVDQTTKTSGGSRMYIDIDDEDDDDEKKDAP